MKRQSYKAIVILGIFYFLGSSAAFEPAYSATLKINVFEGFRLEMVIDHDRAADRFINPDARAKWNSAILPLFNKKDRQIPHFFAFSMMVPKLKASDLYVIYFNPWIDGALLTQWRQTSGKWKMDNFYLASGERIRGQINPQTPITDTSFLPVWLLSKGVFIRNVVAYYKDMRTRLMQLNIDQLLPWFALSAAERDADLYRVKLRMGYRSFMTAGYFKNATSGQMLNAALIKLKYDALTHKKRKLATYSQHADIIADLKPEIIESFKPNWIFTKNNIYSAIFSSIAMPRLFIFMNIQANGKIETALFSDLETMATVQTKASTPPAASVQPSPKVKQYTDAQGNKVEIITEKKNGTVTMTTRVNGKVTEVVNF